MSHLRSALAFVALSSVGCLASQPEAPPPSYPVCTPAVVVVAQQPASTEPSAPLEVAQTPFGSTRASVGRLRGDVYALPEGTPRLPDFRSLQPLGAVYASEINIPPRRFEQGFPGVSDRLEWFGVRYEGNFRVASAGPHRFRILSDDGARLLVDGEPVVVNDGVHPPSSAEGTVTLTAGVHRLELEYFQGPRFDIALQLFWNPPGQDERIFRVEG